MSRILVLDDEITIRELLENLLSREKFQVAVAGRTEQALQILNSEKFDLAIVDLIMPDESGLSALKKIKEKAPALPVIIFSGNVDAEIETKAFASGASEVLSKDIGGVALVEKIKKILEAAPRLAKQTSSEQRAEKILVVDDESAIRSFLSEFFTKKGYRVIEAKDGQEAVDLTKREKPSVILLDINMPGMNGVQTLKRIREFDTEVGVVIATSIQDEQIARDTAALGAYHYVIKPFDLKYLELVVLTRLTIAA